MDNWWNFENNEDRDFWIKKVIEKVRRYHELKTNHAEFAKHSPLGEVGYLNNEISKVITDGLKMGGMAASWIKNDTHRIPNLPKTISQIMDNSKEVIEKQFAGFDADLHHFLLTYLQWEKLTKLLKKAKKKTDPIELFPLFNYKLEKEVIWSFEKLESYNVRSTNEWNDGEFAALCYHAHISCNVNGKHYVERSVSFTRFKKAMLQHFERQDTYDTSDARRYYNNRLNPEKSQKIKTVFK